MRTTRFSRRAVLGAAGVGAALAIAAAATLPAAATTKPVASAKAVATTGTTVRAGSPFSAVDRVADFYGSYIDAVDGDTGNLSDQLRSLYLTTALQTKLTAWEADEHADGVLRAQSIPVSWSVTTDGAGAGHVFTVVHLVWGYGPNPEKSTLRIQSDTQSMLISDIEPG